MGLILSGVQPTGNLHLGNYLGAIKNWVDMQNTHNCYFMLADLHAITVPQNPAELAANVVNVAALYIACGIDPKKSAIFNQSRISGHAELAWILGCSTPLGWLDRMTQFKEKVNNDKRAIKESAGEMNSAVSTIKKILKKNIEENGKPFSTEAFSLLDINLNKIQEHVSTLTINQNNKERAGLGLYSYPVLMAADILLYNATHVPVGEDQKQHLELARDIAGAFNRQYGVEFFKLPEPLIMGAATRVMSLRDGRKKMSKSDESDFSRINLTDSADVIADKIKRAKSDSETGINYDEEKRPEVANLLNIAGALLGEKPQDLAVKMTDYNFAKFKGEMAEIVTAKIAPISAEYKRLTDDKTYLMNVLKDGAEAAAKIADANMAKVKEIVGFI